MRSLVLSTRLPIGVAAAVIGLIVALLSLQLGAGTATGHGSAVLHACWLTAKVEANWSGGVLEVSYVLQPPDPCHTVTGVSLSYDRETRSLVLSVEGESPPRGTYCVQVLPPPVTGHGTVHDADGVARVVLVLRDRATGRTCRAEARLG